MRVHSTWSTAQAATVWDRVRTSLWFVPSMMVTGALILAIGTRAADQIGVTQALPWLGGTEPEGARALLSAVAASMITVAGVTFSITVVALTLASQQFGPRLLRNFMRDPGNQIVLGTFISTFVYCLVVLQATRGTHEEGFVPHLSVAVAQVLTLASLAVLIYFFHHVTNSIRASSVIAAVARDMDEVIEAHYPLAHPTNSVGLHPTARTISRLAGQDEPGSLPAPRSGYLQAVDLKSLLELASTSNLELRLAYRPGHFVWEGSPLAWVYPAGAVQEVLVKQVAEAFVLGEERTLVQDLEFALHQLVEMAVRALSPGTNDPFTAVSCLDYLGAALIKVTKRSLPTQEMWDSNGTLRIVTRPLTFASMVDAAFNQIRQYGRTSASVTIRLLEVIGAIAEQAHGEEYREALRHQAAMVFRGRDGLPEHDDRRMVEERYQKLLAVLGERTRQGGDLLATPVG